MILNLILNLYKGEYAYKQIRVASFFPIPTTMVSVILSENATTETKFKYGFELKEHASDEPASNQAVVKIQAAALNHRLASGDSVVFLTTTNSIYTETFGSSRACILASKWDLLLGQTLSHISPKMAQMNFQSVSAFC